MIPADAEFYAGVLREYADDLMQEPTAIEREFLRKAADFIDRMSTPAQRCEPFKPHENCNCLMCIAEGGEK